LLKTEPLYKPNEADITIAALTTLLTTLRSSHKAVRDAQIALRNAKVARNATLYSESGIHGTTKRVKKYILSVFGATSEQFRSFNSIRVK
jgi:predicted transcriptional regulator